MKMNEKLCDNCFGIAKKRFNWNGHELCENCWNDNVREALEAIEEAKVALTEKVVALEKATGKQIYFGLDDDNDMHVQNGLEIIGKALNKKPCDEKNYIGAPTRIVNGNSVTYKYTDWGKIEGVN